MTDGRFPDTLVLPFVAIFSDGGQAPGVTDQLMQGNTFSVAFDMTQAPHAPGENGLVTLQASAQSNYQPDAAMQLDNEGLADKIEFRSDGAGFSAAIFGESAVVTDAWLSGTPVGDLFTWQAAIWVDNGLIVTNVPLSGEAAARFSR